MDRIKKLLKSMTVDEKIGQLTQYNAAVFLDSTASVTGPRAKMHLTDEDLKTVGSVLNFKSVEEMRQIQQEHMKQDPNKIPMLFMMDVIHGYRTIYPIPLGLSSTFDAKLVQQCSRMAAKEAAADGVHVTFAPMVDYVRDPRWGRVMETCGEEPLLTAELAAAQVRGYQGEDLSKDGSIATCVKHYAGYGGVEAGRDYNMVECSMRQLREFYLPAFKASLDAGAAAIMPSFNALNGIPSVANPLLMRSILRGEWNYDGLVISDYAALKELIRHGVAADEKEAAQKAFENGCDVEMCSTAYFRHLKELIKDGVFTEKQLDAAVERVLRLKERLGLFEDPYRGADSEKGKKLFLCKEHRILAREAATESAVLLKNNGVLPFSENAKKIAVIGPFADSHMINGFWKCNGMDEETVTVFQGVTALCRNARVMTYQGCGKYNEDTDESHIYRASQIAEEADAVILCLGEPQVYSGEGNCRTELGLPGRQMELARQVIAKNPNTAVVLFTGRPLVLTELDAIAPAILNMWFPGTEGGNAAAELLFGKANPSGKLTMTFPRSVGQCPIYYNRTNTGRPNWTRELNHKGYTSDYIDCPTLPLYSFGFGLSYSKFVYSGMTVSTKRMQKNDSVIVQVIVKNDSETAGSEVVQLYMRDLVGSVVRPIQQLIAYQKIYLMPGETKSVFFTVTEPMLRFWNFEGKYQSEKGEFTLMTGYADNFALSQTVELM